MIKELLEHIISFVPRNIIINSALVSKSFYNGIKIDTDQESVAKNADMFSLLKIPYCPDVMINIAAQNNNANMFEYLLDKHKININNPKLCKSIGQSGNEYLISKVHKNPFIEDVKVGICEGLHENLFDKYKVYEDSRCRLILYKTYIDKTKMNQYINVHNIDDIDELRYADIEGYCSRKNANEIKIYIQKLIDKNKIAEVIKYVFRGLIIGNHMELFLSLNKNYTYLCNESHIMSELITQNNYQMFSHILLNNNHDHELRNGRIYCKFKYTLDEFNYIHFMLVCINYKRIEMIKFLINHIIFNKHRYGQFIQKAKSFKFDDIENLLVLNSHLFEDYVE